MTIPLTDSGKGLFEILGKFVHALNTLNTARGTTVATELLDAVEQYKLKTDATLDFDRAVASFPRSEAQWRVGGDSMAAAIARACQGLLIEFVLADDENVPRNLTACLEYLIDEIKAQDYLVSGNTVSVAASSGTGVGAQYLGWVFGLKGKDGRQLDNMLAETIAAEVTASSVSSAVIALTGERSARNKLAETFPAGSGVRKSINMLTVADSLLENAGFEDDTYAVGSLNIPLGWQVDGATGDNLTVRTAKSVSITISGTPTVGEYWLRFQGDWNAMTEAIPYNATGSELQAILRNLPGYEQVTVETTGTSPNFTHEITFHGLNDIGLDSAPDTFDTGGVAESATDGGGAFGINGRTLLLRTGDDTPSLQQTVLLQAGETYVLAVRTAREAGSSPAGVLKISLVDASGTIVTDNNAAQITSSKAVDDITVRDSGVDVVGIIFTMPNEYLQATTRVKIELTEALDSCDLYLDDVILAPATELYPGGPYVAAIGGTQSPQVGAMWTITVSNDYASDWQKAFDQLFDMAGKRLLLPTSGSNLINDSLIA